MYLIIKNHSDFITIRKQTSPTGGTWYILVKSSRWDLWDLGHIMWSMVLTIR